jgi:ankyrin repeat protein
MKYLRLFEDFDSYDPYELMIIPPNKKAEMIVGEIWKDEPNLNLVRDLIVLGANLDWQIAGDILEEGWTPLYWAIKYGRIEIVQMLIDAGADVNAKDDSDSTPLYVAAEFGKTEIARMLIGAGVDVNMKNVIGSTPLHEAAHNGRVKIAHMLIDAGANVNVQDGDGETPLHLAANNGSVEIAKMLIDAGADETILNDEGLRWDEVIDYDYYNDYDE